MKICEKKIEHFMYWKPPFSYHIQQFIHNLGSHVWTSCRPPALEFVLYIHFDNSAHEDSGVLSVILRLGHHDEVKGKA